eukprot:TRINITY_DN4160_c0_g3_i15.p1 TRINITY_DN4160_c0_g3~~TRINITY_DN4160_c0_g3_i15.p1  ORF type:complete len:237 (-),score=45.14 TRINITY_DN4160_c0_g3_i15:538-1248(-)
MSKLRVSQEGSAFDLPSEELEASGERVFSMADKENLHLDNLLESMNRNPQMVDEDVTVFTNKLDSLILSFRTESLKEFIKMKRNILTEQAQRIDAARKNCDALLSSKQDELEKTKDDLATTAAQSKRSSLQIEKLTAHLKKYNKRAVVHYHKALTGWKTLVQKKKRNRQLVGIGLSQCNKMLKSTVLIGWRRQHESAKSKKSKEQTERKLKVCYCCKELGGDREIGCGVCKGDRSA